MGKLVIKITVYKSVDPDLYDSVSQLPLRQRSAVIRRLWRKGLLTPSPGNEDSRMAGPIHRKPAAGNGTTMAAERMSPDASSKLLRQDLDDEGLAGVSAFA